MPTDRAPDDLGRKLREAREGRGISLRQIANTTKISVGVLEALERNDISRLPGGIFSRAFVRSYASVVGLDPEETVREFVAGFPHESVTAGHRPSASLESSDASDGSRRTAATFLRLVAISVPLAAVIVYFAIAGRSRPQPTPRLPAAGPQAVAPLPSGSVAAPVRPVDTNSEDADARLTVSVLATRPSWISATADGEKVVEQVLQRGEQRTIEVRRELVINVRDAGAIAMTLNGLDARPLGGAGETATKRLTPANFREYLAVR